MPEEEIAPIYEIILNSDEPSRVAETSGASAVYGARVQLRCGVADAAAFAPDSLAIHQNGQQLDPARKDQHSATVVLDSFDPTVHAGVYECSAMRTDGKRHARRMRIRHKAAVPAEFIPCDDAHECSNGGVCARTSENLSICVCPENYVGPHCEHVLIKDYIVTGAKFGAAAGGIVNTFLILVCIFLGILFIRERKRRRRWEGAAACIKPLPSSDDDANYAEKQLFTIPPLMSLTPKNSSHHRDEKTRHVGLPPSARIEDFPLVDVEEEEEDSNAGAPSISRSNALRIRPPN